MEGKDATCHTGLAKDVIRSDVFEREMALCQKLSKDGKGTCGWGTCKECGVIPLLYKLHKGVVMEDDVEIAHVKKNILNL